MRRSERIVLDRPVSVRLSEKQIKKIDMICERLGMDRSVVLRLLIECLTGGDSGVLMDDLKYVPKNLRPWFMSALGVALIWGKVDDSDPRMQWLEKVWEEHGSQYEIWPPGWD